MRILVTSDGAPEARRAAAWLTGFPLPASAEIRVISVATLPFAPVDVPRGDELHRAALRFAATAAKEARAMLAPRWPAAEIRVLEGDARDEIVREAEGWPADLVVLGARGLGAVQGFLLGSVSSGVVQHAHCPVLVVKGRLQGFRNAVIAIDGSPDSLAAARFVASLPLGGRPAITLLGVVERAGAGTTDARAIARDVLVRVARDVASGARAVESTVVVGHPAEEIVRAAAEPGVDLVVVGARGLGRFKRLILGSVSERVLHHAACPVLVVK